MIEGTAAWTVDLTIHSHQWEGLPMWRDLAGSRVLITGASSGIGRCLAEQAARKGARLALTGRSRERLEELAGELKSCGGEVLTIPADLTVEEDRKRLVETAARGLGGLDVLVNNAGVGSWGHFAGSSEEVLRAVMEVNFFAPAELIRLAAPILTGGRQPAVLNVASMCGRRGMPAWPEYSAAKFALCGLTESLRGELARFDIDVLLVVPGLIRSDYFRHLLRNEGRERIDPTRGMPPEEVARQVLAALQKNRTETVLGRDARWMLRVNRFLPGVVDWLIRRRIRQLYRGQGDSLQAARPALTPNPSPQRGRAPLTPNPSPQRGGKQSPSPPRGERGWGEGEQT